MRSIHSNRTVCHREVTYILIENTFNMYWYCYSFGAYAAFKGIHFLCFGAPQWDNLLIFNVLFQEHIHDVLKGDSNSRQERDFTAVWNLQKQGSRGTALANWIIQCFIEHFILNIVPIVLHYRSIEIPVQLLSCGITVSFLTL